MLILNTQQNVTCTVYSLIKQIAVNYIILFTKDKVFVTAQKFVLLGHLMSLLSTKTSLSQQCSKKKPLQNET